MTLENELLLSYYREVAPINEAHGVWLVQNTCDLKFYVKKTLAVYNIEVYRHLKDCPVENTPRIYELVEEGGILTVIEEYIPGDTLEALLAAKGCFSEQEVAEITVQLCQILAAFHSRQTPIVNRDIKPSNIKLTQDGIVKLIDMNAAKLCDDTATRDTVLLGTQGYAAPEQYGFGASNIQTDIYSVGVLMNVLLTAHLPAQQFADGKLAQVIRKCVELSPKDRYQTIHALRNALVPFLNGEEHPRQAGWKKYLLPGFRSKNPILWIVSLYGYLLLAYLAASTTVENATPFILAVNRFAIAAAFLGIVLFSGNYLGVHKYFLLTKNKNGFIRLAGILIADFLILSLCAMGTALIEAICQ